MRTIWILSTAACAASLVVSGAAPPFDASRYLAHVKYLASPELKGRATGSPELEKAAHYIAERFQADGLKPVGKGYLHPFQVTTNSQMGRRNRLEIVAGGKTRRLEVGRQFVPFHFSSSGRGEGSVVFAGYGITAPEYNYDDYNGIDVKGKLVVVLAEEPQKDDEKSIFAGKARTDHSDFYKKIANARTHGAAGVIVVTAGDQLEPFGRTNGPADSGILAVDATEDAVAPLFKASGRDLREIEKQIDADLKPRGFAIEGATVHENVDVVRAVKTVHNVAAYLPGESDEYVIVGAHYDHLGTGEHYSLAPSLAGTIHPGADDNASGTAAVIELARAFAAGPKLRRGILFMTFAGEEMGLLGSSYYANYPDLPLGKAAAMVNLDMVGRVRDGKLFIGGAGTGSTLRSDIEEIAPKHPALKLDFSETGGYGSSDHTSFTAKQVPVLFVFSGLHGDYHKPSDTWDKIDGPASVEMLKLVSDIVTKLASESVRPAFIKAPENKDPHSGPVSSGSGGGYGPYFGSIPDFAEPPKGVRFADVREGSPAAQAGLKPGDILIHFGDKEIGNLYDFTYALRAYKVGDEVEVRVLRGGQTVTAKVKLAERR